jgi:hypothetical protein
MLNEEWLRAEKPEPVIRNATLSYKSLASNDSISRMLKCPAVTDELKNLFSLKSLYDYSIDILPDSDVVSKDYNQKFFDEHVIVRDAKAKFISFTQSYIFFTDSKSLEMTCLIPPFLEDNQISQDVIMFPGKFDIGKWFRPIDFSFFLKKDKNQFNINENDIYTYIRFHTKERINFIKFTPTEKIYKYSNSCIRSNSGRRVGTHKLSEYYSKFSIKNKILKEIKENLI